MIPAKAGECVPETPTEGVATSSCTSRNGQHLTWFTLFDDRASMDAYFEATASPSPPRTSNGCPESTGTDAYNLDEGSGLVTCFYSSGSSGGSYPVLMWTEEQALVVGELIGPEGGDLSTTYDWWISLPFLG
jgi:hypothetical protein